MKRKKKGSLKVLGAIDNNHFQNTQVSKEKVKLGEIYQTRDNTITIHCIHCLQEFQFFTEFTLHIEEHYLSGKIQRLKVISQFASNSSIEIVTKDEPPFDIQPELEEANEQQTTNFDNYMESLKEGQEKSDGRNESDVWDEWAGWGNSKTTRTKGTQNKGLKLPLDNESVASNPCVNMIEIHDLCNEDNTDNAEMRKLINNQNSGQQKNLASIKPQNSTPTKATVSIDKLECLTCNRQYASKISLANHVRDMHEPKRFSCSLCLKFFARPGEIRGHIKKIHGVTDKNSINKILVRQTERKVNDGRRRQCFSAASSGPHKQLVHGLKQKCFECFICHRQLANSESVKRHIKRGHGPKQFYCPFCSTEFANPANAKNHIKKMHGVSEYFSIASISVAQRETYKNVFAEHFKRKFECFDCHREFKTFQFLRYHMSRAHAAYSMAKLFSCPLCLARITQLSNVQSHIKLMHNMSYTSKEIRAAQPKSEEVNRKIREDKNRRKIRKPLKNSICEICGMAFMHQSSLLNHMSSHSNRNKFKCEVCHKLISAQYRKEHMQIHTGEKKEQCSICKKLFLNKRRLQAHMFRHVDKANYKCDVCNKAFVRPRKMVEHRRLHAEEMPHVCKTCNVGFMSYNALKHHRYKHEREENDVT